MAAMAPTKPPTTADGIEPPAVRTRRAEQLVPCGKTKLFELIRAGEVDSYLDGKARMIITASIHARRQRLIQKQKNT